MTKPRDAKGTSGEGSATTVQFKASQKRKLQLELLVAVTGESISAIADRALLREAKRMIDAGGPDMAAAFDAVARVRKFKSSGAERMR